LWKGALCEEGEFGRESRTEKKILWLEKGCGLLEFIEELSF
jgi:hypothetical protein